MRGMFPPDVGRTTTQVLVTVFSPELADASVKATALLRSAGLRTQLYAGPARLRDQIGYESSRGIPTVVILGPDEAAAGRLTVRDLRNRRQETVTQAEALALIRTWLA
jgi:histidyl-tRNA synthetase